MARIPVEPDKKGSPWWLWLVGLLLLAGLIWLLAELFQPDAPSEEVVEGDVEQIEPVAPMESAVITDPMQIQNVTEPASFVGRQVQLDNMRIVAAQGDSIFVLEPDNALAGDPMSTPGVTDTPGATGAPDGLSTPSATGTESSMDTTGMGSQGTMNNRILVIRQSMGMTGATPTTGDAESGLDTESDNVTAGETVRISGTLQEIDETMIQNIEVPGVEIDQIAQNGLYVQADDISPMDATTGGALGAEEQLPETSPDLQ